ncbi:unnamed protein product [Musa acuminata subsp. burmannicoides]
MKLIQLGITLFDENGSTPWQGCCWQFNFSDFDPLVHPSSPKSLELLRRSGHDLEGNRRNGINGDKWSNVLRNKLFDRRYGSVYVTFHGLYDVAYVIKLITGGAPLPPTLREFIAAARRVFGALYDIKYIAKYCDGLSGREFGLTSLAQELVVQQDGNPHQAAYDSLSISRVFNEMNRRYNIGGNERFVSVLYGLENSCTESKKRYQRGTMAYLPNYSPERKGTKDPRSRPKYKIRPSRHTFGFHPWTPTTAPPTPRITFFMPQGKLRSLHPFRFFDSDAFISGNRLCHIVQWVMSAIVYTEFSGFIRPTPPYASEEDRYADVKYNVDRMKLIQLGITLFDENGSTPWQGCCWQFNFSDFDPLVHPSSPKSLELLRRSGHDLEGNRRNGINGDKWSNVLRNKLFDRRYGSVYVTFHGLYDVAYVIKLITGGAPLPPTLREFIAAARRVFGALYDIKYIAKYCDGLSGREFGLTSLAQELVMNRRYNIGGTRGSSLFFMA